MIADQEVTAASIRADRDSWRDRAMNADVIIQRFSLERERLLGANAAIRQKLDGVLTEARSCGASETVVSCLVELLRLAREVDARNCPIDEMARRREALVDAPSKWAS